MATFGNALLNVLGPILKKMSCCFIMRLSIFHRRPHEALHPVRPSVRPSRSAYDLLEIKNPKKLQIWRRQNWGANLIQRSRSLGTRLYNSFFRANLSENQKPEEGT